MFEDQDYLSRREEIINKTEDACEAGFALMLEMKRNSRKSKEQENKNDEDEDDDVNAEDVTDLFNDRGGRKRKIAAPSIGEDGGNKRINDESDDSEDDSENEVDPEELEAIRQYFEAKKQDEKDNGEGTSEAVPEVLVDEQEIEPAKRPRLDVSAYIFIHLRNHLGKQFFAGFFLNSRDMCRFFLNYETKFFFKDSQYPAEKIYSSWKYFNISFFKK